MDLTKFPRRKYTTTGPTPLEPMPRLSAALGGQVNLWIKRDDLLGLTGGGNKTRKLEYCMAEALAMGADTVITCGAVQSNHCRLTLSACVKENLTCCLIIEERVPDSYKEQATGNNYLFHLLGAERIIKVGMGEAPAAMEALADELRAKEGRTVYICPGGASNAVGATGYCACAQEMQHQLHQDAAERLPQRFDALVTCSGSGGTHAGLVAGYAALGCTPTDLPIIGISTRHPKAHQTDVIRALAQKTYQRVTGGRGGDLPMHAVQVFDDYVGPGYSLPTPAMDEAVTLFARTEGILLDPVYTGKAAAGLIDLVRKGFFKPGSNVVFLHTGGAPTLYHYQPMCDTVPIPGCKPPKGTTTTSTTTTTSATQTDEKKSEN